ncbi:protein S100-B-like [Sphaeramia orbicularis]|uniref:Protein S100-B-like n=1 Tax=Sphaeramia orbicularis TaxID=375764 RepID=A0A673BJD9_9TELE|nr:protein S100-B-like [Sphaeramia orbicularis]
MTTQKCDIGRIPRIMCELCSIFEEYASADGDGKTLTKAELKNLVEKEMCPMLKEAKNSSRVDDLMSAMDHDGNAKVDFQEFATTIIAFTCICHESMKE